MREIYSSRDVTEVGYYQSILDAAGMSTFIRNENSGNLGGGGPMFLPTLCIIEDGDYAAAIQLLQSKEVKVSASGAEWICSSCSEKNPSNFGSCWKCNAMRPGLQTG